MDAVSCDWIRCYVKCCNGRNNGYGIEWMYIKRGTSVRQQWINSYLHMDFRMSTEHCEH